MASGFASFSTDDSTKGDSNIARRKEFKRTVTQEDGRRKRNENAIQIRKNKRAEGLRKRRAMRRAPVNGAADAGNSLAALANTAVSGMPTVAAIEHLETYKMGTFTLMRRRAAHSCELPCAGVGETLTGGFVSTACMSADLEAQYNGTKQIRRLLSREADPPVEQVIQTGLLPRFVTFLSRQDSPKLQFEAAWALTNVASTEHTSVVVDLGVTPQLVQLLRSPNPDVREQCLWCLGNIAGDRTEYRDMILRTPNALTNLLLNITHPEHTSMLRNAAWALSNFARGKPQPELALIKDALPVVAELLGKCTDTDALTDACWTLSYASDGSNDRIQACLEAGAVSQLVRLLGHEDTNVVTPALRSVGNVVSGTDVQTTAVVRAGALAPLVNLLASSRRGLRKEACWALSNVAAGTPEQVASLMATPGAVEGLINNLNHGEWSVKKEATWAVCNLTTSGTPAQIRTLVQAGVIAALCTTLDKHDAKIVAVALDAIGCILRVGAAEGTTEFCDKVEEDGGLDLIEALQDHANEDIYHKSSSLIRNYFDADAVGEDVDLMPEVAENNTFTFGATPAGGDFSGAFAQSTAVVPAAPAAFSFAAPTM